MLLLSLVDDPETNRAVWILELDGVLAGRFESKEEVAAYLRDLGHRIDPGDDWPRHRLLQRGRPRRSNRRTTCVRMAP